ncbi:MAG: VCBS repeat-containing protein [Crocinitomicaceae bacterium]|nr:VCBS repeat-containing protein [Crocinitomicaceae bacterium]
MADIYVTSDYGLPDFLFINQQNGKFKNEARERLRHASHYSMGLDIADFNNDLLQMCVCSICQTKTTRNQKQTWAA